MKHKGVLIVYRENSQSVKLTASFKSDEGGHTVYFYPCPKCFLDLIKDGTKNKVRIEVSLSDSGDSMKNPRNPIIISDPE